MTKHVPSSGEGDYTIDDLPLLDPADSIRLHQATYFSSGAYNQHEAALQIAAEALLSGAQDIRITRSGPWIAVCAELDWLEGIGATAFEKLLPFPPGGPNSSRSEFLLTVFAESVATAIPSESHIIKGSALGPLIEAEPSWARIVSFADEASL